MLGLQLVLLPSDQNSNAALSSPVFSQSLGWSKKISHCLGNGNGEQLKTSSTNTQVNNSLRLIPVHDW